MPTSLSTTSIGLSASPSAATPKERLDDLVRHVAREHDREPAHRCALGNTIKACEAQQASYDDELYGSVQDNIAYTWHELMERLNQHCGQFITYDDEARLGILRELREEAGQQMSLQVSTGESQEETVRGKTEDGQRKGKKRKADEV